MNPALVVRRKSAGGNHAVHMRMQQQVLTPGVQDAQEADLGSQVLRVGRDFEQCRRRWSETAGHRALRVALAKRIQLMRQREDHMEVRHAEHFLFAGGEPALARLRLALRAVPVAAGVIGDGLMAASGTVNRYGRPTPPCGNG